MIWCTCNFNIFFPVLEGEDIEKEHCVLDFVKGKVTFEPISSMCWVNGVAVTQSTKLNQGMVNMLLDKTNSCVEWNPEAVCDSSEPFESRLCSHLVPELWCPGSGAKYC